MNESFAAVCRFIRSKWLLEISMVVAVVAILLLSETRKIRGSSLAAQSSPVKIAKVSEISSQTNQLPVLPEARSSEDIAPSNASRRIVVGGGACPEKGGNQTTVLEFIHIRKTGGTAIETAAKDRAGIFWGQNSLREKHRYANSTLDRPRYFAATSPRTRGRPSRDVRGNRFHIPPKFFVPYPFEGVATFVVTRDPYKRAVSEYYQRRKGVSLRKPLELAPDDADTMNRWLQESAAGPNKDAFVPQHHYVFADDGRRLVTHVLEFSRLREDFAALMACYAIRVTGRGRREGETLTLPTEVINGRLDGSRLSTANLTNITIRAINKFMRKDFELLGYPMMKT